MSDVRADTLALRRTPAVIRVALLLAVFGYSFPVYGLPVGGFKATFGRIALAMLLPAAVLYNPRWRVRPRTIRFIMATFVVFAIWRFLSLITLGGLNATGVSEVSWFVEGVLFVYALLVLHEKFEGILVFLLRGMFFIGLVSVAVIVIQFLLLLTGYVWTLPLSTSAFGMPPALIERYGYPIGGGGRILGAFFEPNMSGTMCALFFATFFPFVLLEDDVRVASRAVLIAAMLLALVAMVATGSRQALLVIALSAVVLFTIGGIQQVARNFARLAPMVLGVAMVAYVGSYIVSSPQLNPSGERPATALTRLMSARNAYELTGGRDEFIREALQKVTVDIAIWGVGETNMEAVTQGAPHNAYVITLLECGVGGLLTLMILSWALVFAPFRAFRHSDTERSALAAAALCINLSWVALIFVNWAQLNQSTTYMFLGVSLLAIARHARQKHQRSLAPILPRPSGRHPYGARTRTSLDLAGDSGHP